MRFCCSYAELQMELNLPALNSCPNISLGFAILEQEMQVLGTNLQR
jgi:hypothetical protein